MKKLIVFGAMLAFTAILTKAGGSTLLDAIVRAKGDNPSAHPREQMVQRFCETVRLCHGAFLSAVSRDMDDGSQYKACVDSLTKLSLSGQPVKTKLIRSYEDEKIDFSIIEATYGLDTLYFYVGLVDNGKGGKDEKILDMTADKENVSNVMKLMDEMENKKDKKNPRDDADSAPKPAAVPSALTYYTVKEGDDIVSIAIAHGISPGVIMDLNDLKASDEIKPGQVLRLSAKAKPIRQKSGSRPAERRERKGKDRAPGPVAVPSTLTYTVKEGDDLISIAMTYGISPSMIMDLNGLQASDDLKPGQVLKLPANAKPIDQDLESRPAERRERKAKDSAPGPAAAVPSTLTYYTVKEGDDIVSIAIAHGISPGVIMDLNDLKLNDEVKPGQVLKLPPNAKLGD